MESTDCEKRSIIIGFDSVKEILPGETEKITSGNGYGTKFEIEALLIHDAAAKFQVWNDYSDMYYLVLFAKNIGDIANRFRATLMGKAPKDAG